MSVEACKFSGTFAEGNKSRVRAYTFRTSYVFFETELFREIENHFLLDDYGDSYFQCKRLKSTRMSTPDISRF